MRIILILLFYLFTLGQSVDQKWHSEFDQNIQEKMEEPIDDDPSFDVQSSDGSDSEYDSPNVEADSKSDQKSHNNNYQDSQDNVLSDAEYQNELPDELKELVEKLVENDYLTKKQKKLAIEKEIAKILGTYRNKIYAWKREANLLDKKGKSPLNESDEEKRYNLAKKFDRVREEAYLALGNLIKQRGKETKTGYTDEERLAIVNHFMEIKEKYLAQSGPTTAMYCHELDREIARKIGVSVVTIYKWKIKLGMSENPVASEAEKERIMQKYKMLKKKTPKATEKELAKTLGISYRRLCRWKRELGLCEKKMFTDAEKRAFLQKFQKIKAVNPKLKTTTFEKEMQIPKDSIWRWKKKFADQDKFVESTRTKAMDISAYKGPLTDNGHEIWCWNSVTRNQGINL